MGGTHLSATITRTGTDGPYLTTTAGHAAIALKCGHKTYTTYSVVWFLFSMLAVGQCVLVCTCVVILRNLSLLTSESPVKPILLLSNICIP